MAFGNDSRGTVLRCEIIEHEDVLHREGKIRERLGKLTERDIDVPGAASCLSADARCAAVGEYAVGAENASDQGKDGRVLNQPSKDFSLREEVPNPL